ncbi:hypothetical protein Hypma_015188 [Hypsizygus marmoreus]|uniref:Spc7 kinetochore protein domain-containing protein n=1 Tax=Hypsizygus marmoreus TaxID=39966 RepID=A0A369K8D9_HYPMA|nr:hypothetical protein Hypma_015188 [Hypsizygus marmoreus]
MAVSKDSTNRRKSIAVANQNKPAGLPRAKRRPHSIVPGDRLSPFAKAHRNLVPRKSILKAFTNILYNGDDASESQTQSQGSSQTQSQASSADDVNATQSMDITRDFHTKISDNTTRKSFGGRRVSFASSVRVRVIEGLDNNNTNSTQSPQSSPVSELLPAQAQTDENAYPGATSGSRRRSSARYSVAYSEDMDLTTVAPHAFLSVGVSAGEDEVFDDDNYDDGMEMTEVIHGDLIRKRSLSIGNRPPLAQKSQAVSQQLTSGDDGDQSQSFEEDDSRSQSDGDPDHSQPMDFTIPLSRSLRPPPEHDAAWLALRQATHSGHTPIEREPSSDDYDPRILHQGDGMDLDDAVQRLMRARESLPSVPAICGSEHEPRDDTFSGAGDSSVDEDNQTMNVSKVLGRASLGGAQLTRISMGYQESTMDESEIYGAIVAPNQSTPRQSLAQPPVQSQHDPVQTTSFPTVFQPPPRKDSSNLPGGSSLPSPRQQPAAAVPFTFTPAVSVPSKPNPQTSPARPKQVQRPSAAFAPPVSRPTPQRPTAAAPASPHKRTRPAADGGQGDINGDSDRPSSAKRLAVAGKWPFAANMDVAPSAPSPKPKPLSPSKRAPFQAPSAISSLQRPSSSLRRPSGYFARRKSLGTALASNSAEDGAPSDEVRISPKKKAGLGLGRASLGSGAADAWTRFDKDAISKGKEKEKEKEDVHSCDREASRQAAASPTVTRGSPAPSSPRPRSPAPLGHTTPSSPEAAIVDISTLLGPEEYGQNQGQDDMQVDPTEQWRHAVEPGDFDENDEPPISIKQFFSMTGIKFMDELTAPRRSIHPSQQGVRQARNEEDILLAEYVIAMGLDVPQLVLYSRVSKDLEAWIEKSKADFDQAEDEAAKITPELFTEYSRADEEGQAELLHQLQLIRTNTRAQAKSDWYDWKLQWLEGLRVTADKTFKSLEEDAKTLEGIRATADEVIPALEQEYEEITRELEKEKAEVAEIEASDQDYLNELKASIAEQNIEVEALKAEVAESKAQLVWLQERFEEVESQKREATTAISNAQRVLHIQKNSTRAEVFKLKDELEALEDLHMFRTTKVHGDLFEYVYASRFRVSIPCKNFVPVVKRVDVIRVDNARTKVKDNFPRLSDFLLHMAKEQIVRGENRTTRQIIHRLSDYWSSCAQLRLQLKLLTIKYPLEIEVSKGSNGEFPYFKAKVMVLFPPMKAKAFVSFVFSTKTFCYWPMAISSLGCEVEVAYGNVDRQTIHNAVTDRLSQASAGDNYACLLDACIEAQELYH